MKWRGRNIQKRRFDCITFNFFVQLFQITEGSVGQSIVKLSLFPIIYRQLQDDRESLWVKNFKSWISFFKP